jgi:hypothetical protein
MDPPAGMAFNVTVGKYGCGHDIFQIVQLLDHEGYVAGSRQ